jgi:hypothetical protein
VGAAVSMFACCFRPAGNASGGTTGEPPQGSDRNKPRDKKLAGNLFSPRQNVDGQIAATDNGSSPFAFDGEAESFSDGSCGGAPKRRTPVTPRSKSVNWKSLASSTSETELSSMRRVASVRERIPESKLHRSLSTKETTAVQGTLLRVRLLPRKESSALHNALHPTHALR